jgi:hypothetical protein
MKSLFRVLGILFLVVAPLCVGGAGAYVYFQPRLFRSMTEFQLLVPSADGPRLPDAFREAQQKFPAMMKQPLVARVSLQPAGAADRYRLIALDADPQTAAVTANVLTIVLMETLRAGSATSEPRMTVLTKGERASAPSFPDVAQTVKIGTALALLCGAVGAILLVVSLRARF